MWRKIGKALFGLGSYFIILVPFGISVKSQESYAFFKVQLGLYTDIHSYSFSAVLSKRTFCCSQTYFW